MLSEVRSLAWRKESNARAVKRLTCRDIFETAFRSAPTDAQKQAKIYIENSDIEKLQDWVRDHTRDLTSSELKTLAAQLGIRRYSRMPHEQLRREVEKIIRDTGSNEINTDKVRIPANGDSVQS